MKKVLITGSEGYIGKHLIQMLGNKYDIYKLDLKDPTTSLDIRTVNWDLEFDTIVHLAALVNVSRSTKYPENYFDTNVNGTRHLLKNLKYKNFVFASTGSAAGMASPYGISKKMAELVVEDYCKNQNKDFTMLQDQTACPRQIQTGYFLVLCELKKKVFFICTAMTIILETGLVFETILM
jgi:nucleoside-diphosphate-sugar epimerase